MEPTWTPNRTQPLLPFDVIYNIIESIDDREDDAMYQDNIISPVLIACSLVCWAWNDICRPRIFRMVAIHPGSKFTSRLAFLHFTAPHISEHILELRLHWDDDIRMIPDWVPDCLNRLTNLRSLRLTSDTRIKLPTLKALSSLGLMSLINVAPLQQIDIRAWEVEKDGSDILPMLLASSTTLGYFSLHVYSISDHGTATPPQNKGSQSRAPSIVRLEALNCLELGGILPNLDFIECPNVESLRVLYVGDDEGPWGIHAWIPADLPHLIMQASCEDVLPDLGQSIRSPHLTLDLCKSPGEPYLDTIELARNCIDRLPFPNDLRKVTVVIKSTEPDSDASGEPQYPSLEDYKYLSHILQPLHEGGALGHADIGIMTHILDDKVHHHYYARETAKVREAFLPYGQWRVGLSLTIQ